MKHTPGPWITGDYCDEEQGYGVLATDYPHDPHWTPTRGITAWVHNLSSRPRDECDANARLIAAAPDLLDALKDIVENCGAIRIDGPICPACGRFNREHGNICTSDDCTGVQARAAIAKAKGESE